MGQRVNIQYSVELEDLQKEVNRLFANAIKELDIVSPVGGTASLKLGTDGLDKIDLLRRKLAKVDTMLGDIQNIVEGYIRFKTQPPPPPEEREIPFEQTSDELEIEHLEEQIKEFKEFFIANANQESKESS
jgi:hypothetical protein